MPTNHQTFAQPPSARQRVLDQIFGVLTRAAAWIAGLLVAVIVLQIAWKAVPAVREHGLSFLTGTTWDPKQQQFGILPQIWGTLYSSLLAIVIGGVLGLCIAIFLSEGFLGSFAFRVLSLFGAQHRRWALRIPDRADLLLRNLVELLAAIPSVVYGLWGIFVVIPLIRPWADWLHARFGWTALFSEPLQGPGLLPAVIVLTVMILPTVTALSRDALASVPPKLRIAAYGIGATRWETMLAVLLPAAKRGIFGAIVIAFGRALGETMALAMLIGNANKISLSILSPANTLAALLANSFPEAGPKEVPVLMFAALTLLLITLVVNVFGALIMSRAGVEKKA
ncbi:MAG TPA: phosphate ABC transporter permease subunit PstC [Polyangiales bacterium]|nr:phosphate ABC transporter permease subunit PstC [Polyangiales bacterium]